MNDNQELGQKIKTLRLSEKLTLVECSEITGLSVGFLSQIENAKEELAKPFDFEDELKEKTERLNALNIELNLDQKDPAVLDAEPEETNELPERKAADRER